MRKRMLALVFLGIVGLAAMLACETRAATMGDCIARYTKTVIYAGCEGSYARHNAPFNPAVPLDWTDLPTSFLGRYGHGVSGVWAEANGFPASFGDCGELVGERYSTDGVYPKLGMVCPELPPGYVLTDQDHSDMVYANVGSRTFFDAFFFQAAPPPPAPPPPPGPVAPPAPPPVSGYPPGSACYGQPCSVTCPYNCGGEPDPTPAPSPSPSPTPTPAPSPEPCAKPAPCPAPPVIAADCLQTAKDALSWWTIGPNRAARLKRLLACVAPFSPAVPSTGASVIKLEPMP